MIREYVVKVTDALVPDAFQRFESEWSPEQEIVRCKDCRRNHQCAIQFKFADADDEENWFCADGERKSTDEILMEKMDADPLG